MKKIPFTNETDTYLTIGTVTIAPGMTRDVEETLHPDYKPAQVEAETGEVDIVDVLLSGPVDELLKCLPELSDEDLDRLDDKEQQAASPRSEVLTAVSALQLTRADASQQPVAPKKTAAKKSAAAPKA